MAAWDSLHIPECPQSARDGCGGRPTTRDGRGTPRDGSGSSRPCTQDGGRQSVAERRQGLGLDGVRPSTREDLRLQQQIGGQWPPRRNSPADVSLRRPPSEGVQPSPRTGVRQQPKVVASPRPSTQGGDGSARPPTRSGPPDRRCQDVTIRKRSGSKSRSHQANGTMATDAAKPGSSPSPGLSRRSCGLSRSPGRSSSGSDASIDLL
mmetsp:Transcript_57934/g.161681  ORF Transcript_57934/g.161681 Transcript_57934/m.161681 type:complete len:207 (+) Transcript_57934:37-657(+)